MKFRTLAHFSAVLASFALITAPVYGQSGGRGEPASQLQPSTSTKVVAGTPVIVPGKVGAKSQVKDIVLNPSGRLTLTVVRSSGHPLVGEVVSVLVQSTPIARAMTNSKGQVIISGLKPGMHIVQTGLTKTIVRFWSPQLAPPQAVARPAIVDTSDLVRGQYGYGYGAPMAPGLVAATITAIGVGAVVIGKSSSSDNVAPVDPASP